MALPPKTAYHHGDLRDALIQATLALIEAQGVDGFSLREVGRQAGVSPRAPYHHFESRAALLAILAQRGYALLGTHLGEAAARAPSPDQIVSGLIEAYVGFAQTQRALFQVMFRPTAYDKAAHPEVAEAGDRAVSIVVDALSVCDPQLSKAEMQELAVLVWTVAHGAASLLTEGALERRSALMGLRATELAARVARNFGRLLAQRQQHG